MNFKLSAENTILGILMTGPHCGYDLRKYISTHMSQFWDLSMSQVYALLQRMERDHMVISQEEWQKTRPSKKIFTLTPKGKDAFLDWVRSPVEHVRDMRIEFMAKLFFIRKLGLPDCPGFLDRQIAVVEEKLQGIEHSKNQSTDEFEELLYSFKASQTTAVLAWLRQLKASSSSYQNKAME